MEMLYDLINNPYLIVGLSSWLIAQVLKTCIYALVNRSLDLRRLCGDGGMPSAHSATVTSVAMLCALMCGTGSFEFAISTILALIVCHDAAGVRQEAGKHAILLDELIALFEDISTEPLPEVRLKKFVGHTHLQVLVGALIGILNAALLYHLCFRL